MFIKHCTVLIERRGFSNIHLGVKKLSRDGKVETFDISYGYVIRHYCKCNFGDNPVQESEIKAFEKSLLRCNILPTRGVFFSQSPFVKGDLDFDVLLVDPENYSMLYQDAVKDRVIRYCMYCACICATILLYWSFVDDLNVHSKRWRAKYRSYKREVHIIHDEEEEDDDEEEVIALWPTN
ncbi:hypothetical protein JH06_0214 [Blastocystis sp. subtype 4]|uniref:hypothetical protein n=1 Tax=Blastocystis sp. subtype 4 TaxID=944170 RepID=UPI00071203E5|nr:hypothetical protein JH06_0214 [Blastocystis sp. subtype 4]KNB46437.1 hypothetical protein JH06_0214 [Blastocystis sp. subtype 4]|eukprot:XP_014529880.1 hypothetical protein JH06_0214 [Blastocystis sp. subtype 4]